MAIKSENERKLDQLNVQWYKAQNDDDAMRNERLSQQQMDKQREHSVQIYWCWICALQTMITTSHVIIIFYIQVQAYILYLYRCI